MTWIIKNCHWSDCIMWNQNPTSTFQSAAVSLYIDCIVINNSAHSSHISGVWTFPVYGIMNFAHCHHFTLCNPFLTLFLLFILPLVFFHAYIEKQSWEWWSKKNKMLLPFVKSDCNWPFLCHFHKWLLFFAFFSLSLSLSLSLSFAIIKSQSKPHWKHPTPERRSSKPTQLLFIHFSISNFTSFQSRFIIHSSYHHAWNDYFIEI